MKKAMFAGLALVAVALPASAGAATYSNPTPITAEGGPGNPGGAATLYPSGITVSGEAGAIVKVRATLNNLFGIVRAFDVLLVGPGASTILFSDACSAGGFVPDFNDTLTFDDDATGPVPETCSIGQPVSGTYKPANYDTADNFPGIPGPYPVGLGNFRGLAPNGIWNLYLVDDDGPEAVRIDGGWTLELTTTGAPVTGQRAAALKKCRKKKSKKKRKKCRKRALRQPV